MNSSLILDQFVFGFVTDTTFLTDSPLDTLSTTTALAVSAAGTTTSPPLTSITMPAKRSTPKDIRTEAIVYEYTPFLPSTQAPSYETKIRSQFSGKITLS